MFWEELAQVMNQNPFHVLKFNDALGLRNLIQFFIQQKNKQKISISIASARKLSPLIFTGPSGAGKSTLINRLLKIYPQTFELSVSHTTRNARPGEIEGKHYYFTEKNRFDEMIKQDSFLEHEEVHKNKYGTSKQEIERIQGLFLIPLLDIDIKGAININRKNFLKESLYLFILPKSIEDLRQRLIARKTETEESLNIRVKNAEAEIEKAKKSGIYNENQYIVNDDLDIATEELSSKIKNYYSL